MQWQTPEKSATDTIHFTDEYVVHGRGFTVNDDIWYDEYNVYGEHTHLWNSLIRHRYDCPKYEGNWTDYAQRIDPTVLYWSVTGSEVFLVQHPSNPDEDQLRGTLDAFDWPEDATVREGTRNDDSGRGHAQSILRKL